MPSAAPQQDAKSEEAAGGRKHRPAISGCTCEDGVLVCTSELHTSWKNRAREKITRNSR
jgi:hypothetical protein